MKTASPLGYGGGSGEEFVRNGDRMALFSETCCGFLASDGITSNSLVVERLDTDEACEKNPLNLHHYPNHFERCVFTLTRIDIWDSQGLGNVTGDPLLYGQVITLRHIYTDTLLCVNRRTQSTVAVGCNKVGLVERSQIKDRSHYFKILPRYKVRSEGDRVRSTDQIMLKPELEERYLHVTELEQHVTSTTDSFYVPRNSDAAPGGSECWKFEVNISNTPAEWRVHIFDTQAEEEDHTVVRVGTPIAIFHKEREGFAAAAHHTESTAPDAKDTLVYLNIPQRTNQRTYNIETLSYSVNCVWMIERANTTLGGPVMLVPGYPRRPTYRIKHLASHRYLAVVPDRAGIMRTTLLSSDDFHKYDGSKSGSTRERGPRGRMGSRTDDDSQASDDDSNAGDDKRVAAAAAASLKADEDGHDDRGDHGSPLSSSSVLVQTQTFHDPTSPQGLPQPPGSASLRGSIHGRSRDSTPSPPFGERTASTVAMSREGAGGGSAGGAGGAGGNEGSKPREISFQIPSIASIERQRKKEKTKKPLDQMKGRAHPPTTTLFYIYPLDEGQTKLHSATTFTKMQHVDTRRWVQVRGSAGQAVRRTPQRSQFQQALLKKNSLSQHALKSKLNRGSLSDEASRESLGSEPDAGGLFAEASERLSADTMPVESHSPPAEKHVDKNVFKIIPTERRTHDDVWCIARVPQEKLLGLNTVVECKAKLQQYIYHFTSDEVATVETKRSTMLGHQTKLKLEQLIVFCSDSKEKDPLLRDGLPLPTNQELLFSQDIHKLLMRMLGMKAASTIDLSIGKLCYWLLRAMIKGSTQNASQLLRYIKVFKAHICNPGYGVCDMLLELYRNNKHVLDDVDEGLIQQVVDYIMVNGIAAAPFNLLAALCVCNGEAVPRAQACVLDVLLANPALIMHTLVSHDNRVFVKIPAETVVAGKPQRTRRSSRTPTTPPTGLSRSESSPRQSPAGSPVAPFEQPGPIFAYGSWVSVHDFCSLPNKIAEFYKAMLGLFVSLCRGNHTQALVEVRRWMPADAVLALIGHESVYWGERVAEQAILWDIQAVTFDLALHAHIIPTSSTPPQGASRLVVAWHDTATCDPTARSSCYVAAQHPVTQSLKTASKEFLGRNARLVYTHKEKSQLVSSMLVLWLEVIRRSLFDRTELDEMLPHVTRLMDGTTDMLTETDDRIDFTSSTILGAGLRSGTKKSSDRESEQRAEERRQYNEYSALVMHTKLLATELFNSRLEHEASFTQLKLIDGFKKKMEKIEPRHTPPPSPRKRGGQTPPRGGGGGGSGGESAAGGAWPPGDASGGGGRRSSTPTLPSHSSMTCARDEEFVMHFRTYLEEAVKGRYLRQQNAALLPVCLDLSSYHYPELTHRVLTFVFKSLWFGAEIAANLQQAQILFSDESWVLFQELTVKKQTLSDMLANVTQAHGCSEDERCCALLGDLVSLLQPAKGARDRDGREPSSRASPERSDRKLARRQSFRGPRRQRKGSIVVGRKAAASAVHVDHSAVLAERQDIFRNLGFHELVAEKVLTLPLSASNVRHKSGWWDIIHLGYVFLKQLCEDHLANQEAVSVLITDYLIRHIDKGVGANELAKLLYEKNYHLSIAVPCDLLKGLVDLVVEGRGGGSAGGGGGKQGQCAARSAASQEAAEVLKCLLVCHDADAGPDDARASIPVPRNQTLCMNYLLEKASGLKIFDNLTLYVNNELLYPHCRDDRAGDDSVEELCGVLEIISLCCQGQNTTAEMGGQCIMPLSKLLQLICATVSALLAEPLERGRGVPLGSPGLTSLPSPTNSNSKEDGYPPHAAKSPHLPDPLQGEPAARWVPPRNLVSVLLLFLHNVYLHEGAHSETSSGVVGAAKVELDKENAERMCYEWSVNGMWWLVFKSFRQLLHDWIAHIEADKEVVIHTRPAKATPAGSFLSVAVCGSNELNGLQSPTERHETFMSRTEELTCDLLFKDIIPCVGTYLASKFQIEMFVKADNQALDEVELFVRTALSLCSEDSNVKLSRAQRETLHGFLRQVVASLKRPGSGAVEEEVAAVFPYLDDIAEYVSRPAATSPHGERHDDVPRASTQRLHETCVLERFGMVQDYLLETFTEGVNSLNTLLHLIRCEMEHVPDDPLAKGKRDVPAWLASLVRHLEDPDLPEQVITGLLKVFTKLIKTASMPQAKMRDAVFGRQAGPQGRAGRRRGLSGRLSPVGGTARGVTSPTGSGLGLGLGPRGASACLPSPSSTSSLEADLDADIDSDVLQRLDDEEAEIELTPAIVSMQTKLNNLGLTSCMVKLTERNDGNIAHEAICFGIALLHGGNKKVQDSMLDFFLNNDESFFVSMKESISLAAERLRQRNRELEFFEDQLEPVVPMLGSIGQVLRLLQLVCEGHHLRLQNYVRLQDDNLRSTNVVREVLLFLRTLMHTDGLITESAAKPTVQPTAAQAAAQKADKEALLGLAQQTFDTLTEFCQGPCPENQNEIVSSNICGLVDGLLQAAGWQLLELKSKAITTLLSVLEGSSGKGTGSCVDIMLKTLPFDTIKKTLESIWDMLISRNDESGNVFKEMDVVRPPDPVKRPAASGCGFAEAAVVAAAAGSAKDHMHSHYVYEDAWMENACEVLGVMEHVDKGSGPSLSDLLDVSFNLYILLLTLSSWSTGVERDIDALPGSRYFKRMVGTIEIARGTQLEKVYFRIPSTCSGLSRQTRHKVLWDLRDKESRAAKLGGFFEVSGELIAEMRYLHGIRSDVQRSYITNQETAKSFFGRRRQQVSYRLGQFFTSPATQDVLRGWNVHASLVTNAVLLFSYSAYEYTPTDAAAAAEGQCASDLLAVNGSSLDYRLVTDPAGRLGHGLAFLIPGLHHYSPEQYWGGLLETLVSLMCMLHVAFSLSDVYLWWTLRIRRILQEVCRSGDTKMNFELLKRVVQAFPRETTVGLVWRVLSIVVSLAGVFWSPFFSALHLLAVIPQSSHLRNVVSAVSLNGRTLLMTFAFGVLVVYHFSVLGYIMFHQDYVGDGGLGEPNCVTLLQCFTFTLMSGMRAGGGVGDIIAGTPLKESAHYSQRMVFDYLFFLGVIIILLSIVSGIITDSFTELRKRKDDFEDEKRNFCFVCGIESSTFERYLKGGFKVHTTKQHNMWNYLYFHHHLLTKQEDEFTGQESYVWERIKELDFSFYPINKSMSLMEMGVLEDDDADTTEEAMRVEMMSMSRRLADFENTVSQMVTKISQLSMSGVDSQGDSLAHTR